MNLHRYPRGTDYPTLYRSVQSVMRQLPSRERKAELLVDKTGVGAPVVDAMRAMGMAPIGANITGGLISNMIDSAITRCRRRYWPACSTSRWPRSGSRSPKLPGGSEALRLELQKFHARVKPSGSLVLEAWREGHHDDLVLSLALAVWYGENLPQPARWISATERMQRGWGIGR